MPAGVCLDCAAVLIGGLFGSGLKNKIPKRLNHPLTVVFGISAILIGVVSFIKLNSMPAVILAMIVGTLVGELADLDTRLKKLLKKIIKKFHFKIEGDEEWYMSFYIIVAATFCASGTNIFGAMNEAMTGDITILLSKAVMDIFAGIIFACTLGYAMLIIVVPQFVILSAFFWLGKVLMPYISETALMDFTAVGGLITFVIGLSIADIKNFRAVNMLPSLAVVFPVSMLFSKFF